MNKTELINALNKADAMVDTLKKELKAKKKYIEVLEDKFQRMIWEVEAFSVFFLKDIANAIESSVQLDEDLSGAGVKNAVVYTTILGIKNRLREECELSIKRVSKLVKEIEAARREQKAS